MKHRYLPIAYAALLLFSAHGPNALSGQIPGLQPDALPPIGVSEAVVPPSGGLLLHYGIARAKMADNFNGATRLSTAGVLEDFQIAPLTNTTRTHLFGAMYAVNERITLAAAGVYSRSSMNHVTGANEEFTIQAAGFGDLSLAAIIALRRFGPVRALLRAGVSLPTGSITNTDEMPSSGPSAQLPYVMQSGSGTLDFAPGLAVLGTAGRFSLGAQTGARLPLGDNERGWRRGAAFHGTAWVALGVTVFFEVSGRVLVKRWGEIQGFDAAFTDPHLVPTVRPELQAGFQVELPIGFAVSLPAGNRLAMEWSRTVVRDLSGPQLGANSMISIGWQKAIRLR